VVETPSPVTVEELRKLSKKALRVRANEQLALVDTANADSRDLHIHNADLFVRELERRRDYWSWVSLRDLILEIIVIGLIGWEIGLSYQQEKQQSANFSDQQRVLGTMDTSASKTATAMTTLQAEQTKLVTAQQQSLATLRDTLKSITSMNTLLNQQVKMAYDVVPFIMFNGTEKRIEITNTGKTAISARGVKYESEPAWKFPENGFIVPGSMNYLPTEQLYSRAETEVPKGSGREVNIQIYFESADGKQYIAHVVLHEKWDKDKMIILTTTTSTSLEPWPSGIK